MRHSLVRVFTALATEELGITCCVAAVAVTFAGLLTMRAARDDLRIDVIDRDADAFVEDIAEPVEVASLHFRVTAIGDDAAVQLTDRA